MLRFTSFRMNVGESLKMFRVLNAEQDLFSCLRIFTSFQIRSMRDDFGICLFTSSWWMASISCYMNVINSIIAIR